MELMWCHLVSFRWNVEGRQALCRLVSEPSSPPSTRCRWARHAEYELRHFSSTLNCAVLGRLLNYRRCTGEADMLLHWDQSWLSLIITTIIPGQLVKRHMCTLCTSRVLSQWAMMGKDEACSINRVNYRRHDTFTCTVGRHLQHLYHRIGIITSDKLRVPIYRPERMDSWVS